MSPRAGALGMLRFIPREVMKTLDLVGFRLMGRLLNNEGMVRGSRKEVAFIEYLPCARYVLDTHMHYFIIFTFSVKGSRLSSRETETQTGILPDSSQ